MFEKTSNSRFHSYAIGEWDALTDEERDKYANKVNRQFDKVAAEADFKWAAVKVMLDL